MSNSSRWLTPWYAVDVASERAALEGQLQREISSRHVLAGQAVRLVARRMDTDDALFALDDGRVAEVHLTWRQGTEPDPRWPFTALFPSLEDWMRLAMVPLHRELARDP